MYWRKLTRTNTSNHENNNDEEDYTVDVLYVAACCHKNPGSVCSLWFSKCRPEYRGSLWLSWPLRAWGSHSTVLHISRKGQKTTCIYVCTQCPLGLTCPAERTSSWWEARTTSGLPDLNSTCASCLPWWRPARCVSMNSTTASCLLGSLSFS